MDDVIKSQLHKQVVDKTNFLHGLADVLNHLAQILEIEHRLIDDKADLDQIRKEKGG